MIRNHLEVVTSFTDSESQSHLVPDDIAVNGFGYSFIDETELRIERDPFFLAG